MASLKSRGLTFMAFLMCFLATTVFAAPGDITVLDPTNPGGKCASRHGLEPGMDRRDGMQRTARQTYSQTVRQTDTNSACAEAVESSRGKDWRKNKGDAHK